MAEDASGGSGTIPEPIPEVQEEGPGGADLNLEDSGDQVGQGAEGGDSGTVPTPTAPGEPGSPSR